MTWRDCLLCQLISQKYLLFCDCFFFPDWLTGDESVTKVSKKSALDGDFQEYYNSLKNEAASYVPTTDQQPTYKLYDMSDLSDEKKELIQQLKHLFLGVMAYKRDG